MGNPIDKNKMQLAYTCVLEVKKAQEQAIGQLLGPNAAYPNVVGVATGIKWTTEEGPTGEPAILVLVEQKLDKSGLASQHLIPSKLYGMQTDVISVGKVMAQPLIERIRPVKGGYSVGHKSVTAGTAGAMVYDRLEDDTVGGRIGIPTNYYILSNNHVLAACNQAQIGDAILQPGPYDGGIDPTDVIGALAKFVPIQFYPDVPLADQTNVVDAAIATGDFHNLDREIFWIGQPRGYMTNTAIDANIGMVIRKTGRTTSYTTGHIIAVNTVLDVNYANGKVARFTDQVLASAMSHGGDSGSLVLNGDNIAIGLLFAGSSCVTTLNTIQNVQDALNVTVAETLV